MRIILFIEPINLLKIAELEVSHLLLTCLLDLKVLKKP